MSNKKDSSDNQKNISSPNSKDFVGAVEHILFNNITLSGEEFIDPPEEDEDEQDITEEE